MLMWFYFSPRSGVTGPQVTAKSDPRSHPGRKAYFTMGLWTLQLKNVASCIFSPLMSSRHLFQHTKIPDFVPGELYRHIHHGSCGLASGKCAGGGPYDIPEASLSQL